MRARSFTWLETGWASRAVTFAAGLVAGSDNTRQFTWLETGRASGAVTFIAWLIAWCDDTRQFSRFDRGHAAIAIGAGKGAFAMESVTIRHARAACITWNWWLLGHTTWGATIARERLGLAHFFFNAPRIGALNSAATFVGLQDAAKSGWRHRACDELRHLFWQFVRLGLGKFLTLTLTQMFDSLRVAGPLPTTVNVRAVKTLADTRRQAWSAFVSHRRGGNDQLAALDAGKTAKTTRTFAAIVDPVATEAFLVAPEGQTTDRIFTESVDARRIRSADEDIVHHILLIGDVGDVHRIVDVGHVAAAIDDVRTQR